MRVLDAGIEYAYTKQSAFTRGSRAVHTAFTNGYRGELPVCTAFASGRGDKPLVCAIFDEGHRDKPSVYAIFDDGHQHEPSACATFVDDHRRGEPSACAVFVDSHRGEPTARNNFCGKRGKRSVPAASSNAPRTEPVLHVECAENFQDEVVCRCDAVYSTRKFNADGNSDAFMAEHIQDD